MALRCFNLKLIRITLSTWRNITTQAANQFTTSSPIVLSQIINKNDWIYQKYEPINIPALRIPHINYVPVEIIKKLPVLDPINTKFEIEEPVQKYEISKEAARLIVIRRRKMRRHKLKKLRKRLKFERAKIRQRRELQKEKLFQAQLLAQIKEAETFSAEEYVSNKIRQAKENPIPRYWKGKRLPEFIIRQKLGLPPK